MPHAGRPLGRYILNRHSIMVFSANLTPKQVPELPKPFVARLLSMIEVTSLPISVPISWIRTLVLGKRTYPSA